LAGHERPNREDCARYQRGGIGNDIPPGPFNLASGKLVKGPAPLIDKPCAEELLRVLAYPKFRLAPDDIQTLLGAYLPFTEAVGAASTKIVAELPHCSDPHDQKFLILAEMGKADALVTGDRALLALAGQTRFAIETPSTFRQRIGR
jgi:predicted nucleic acid-binding protein